MKVATYLLGSLLVAALSAAAFFYFSVFEPVLADYNRLKAGLPQFEKASADLKKYREKEAEESGKRAWIMPAAAAFSAVLDEQIRNGKAEVTTADSGVVINISEEVLYTPDSVTFAGKHMEPLLKKLAAALGSRDLKGKTIIIGNTTDAVPAQRIGRRKVPPREARAIAMDRSMALVKYFEKNKVDKEALAAAGYAEKMPDAGFRIKDHKTVIVIGNVPAPVAASPAQPNQMPSASQAPSKGIPIQRPQPDAH